MSVKHVIVGRESGKDQQREYEWKLVYSGCDTRCVHVQCDERSVLVARPNGTYGIYESELHQLGLKRHERGMYE